MSLLSLALVAATVALTPSVHAQSLPAHSDEVDTAHDLPANDPSVGKPALPRKSKPQRDAMIERLFSRAGEKLTPHFHRYPTYQEILNNDPKDFHLLQLHQNRYTPLVENGMTAVNADHEFVGISDRKFGLCWGFATLHRNFSVLAFFDANSREGIPGKRGSDEWLEFYRGKIDEIAEGHATLFPGMANLRELSLVPELELYLKIVSQKLWASRAVHRSSVGILRKSTDWLNFEEVESLLRDLEARLSRGEYPKIIFSGLIPSKKFLGMNADIHAVLVYKVERGPDATAKIHLWDINFYAETLIREPKMIVVTPQHGLLYEPWYEPNQPYAKGSDLLARVSLAPENDAETAEEIVQLKRFCSNRATARYCR
jgi:hypothetical protein